MPIIRYHISSIVICLCLIKSWALVFLFLFHIFFLFHIIFLFHVIFLFLVIFLFHFFFLFQVIFLFLVIFLFHFFFLFYVILLSLVVYYMYVIFLYLLFLLPLILFMFFHLNIILVLMLNLCLLIFSFTVVSLTYNTKITSTSNILPIILLPFGTLTWTLCRPTFSSVKFRLFFKYHSWLNCYLTESFAVWGINMRLSTFIY